MTFKGERNSRKVLMASDAKISHKDLISMKEAPENAYDEREKANETEREEDYTGSIYSSNSQKTSSIENEYVHVNFASENRNLAEDSFMSGIEIPKQPRTRESFVSNLSDYTVQDKKIAEPVSITVVNRQRESQTKYRPSGSLKELEESEEPRLKLTTEHSIQVKKRQPDMAYETSIDGVIPPRSSRRPKSEVLVLNNELSQDIENYNKRHSNNVKRLSINLSDDLDKLMEKANMMAIRDTPQRECLELKHIEKPQIEKPQIEDSASVADSRVQSISNESYPNPNLHENASLHTLESKIQAVPPRPSADNVRRAREVSSQFREMQTKASSDEESRDAHPLVSDHENKENDYIDTESVVYEKPARGISVKASIRPSKKLKHKKAKHKRVRNSNQGLMPFSYQTLINLLESTNGTVIGEEFEKLDLPTQEKQLLEKIIDSLSRLTLDMVIDSNRYEVGLQRLEKALRALEGFI